MIILKGIYKTHALWRRARHKGVLALFFLCLPHVAAADDPALSLSLDEYTSRAIEKGIRGRENSLRFESAGYSREIAFRQTDSPRLSASANSERAGTDTNGNSTITTTNTGGLTLNELLPTGTEISAQGQTSGARITGSGDTTTSKIFSATVSQPLYIFVKNPVLRTRRQADLAFANARDAFQSTLLSLRSQARNFYYQVILGDESIKVAQRKLASSRKLLDITQAMVQGGKTAPVESMRAKIRLQDDDRQLQNTIVNHAKAVLNAKNFIYMPLDEDVYFSSRLEFKPLQTSQERLVQYALVHNPQLRTLRRARELAELDLQATMETTRPKLSLDSSYRYNETTPSLTRQWTLGAGVQWLFFDSFVTRYNVSKARIDLTIADLNLSEAERTTQLNVQNAYLDLKNSQKQIEDFTGSIEQARRNVDVVQLRFRNGLERLIDVFDAENDMRNLDNQYLGLVVSFNQVKDSLSEQVGADVEKIK